MLKLKEIKKSNRMAVLCIFLAAFLLAGCSPVKEAAKNFLQGRVKPSGVQTGLPVVWINTEGKRPVTGKESYIKAQVKIVDPDNTENNIEGAAEVRLRGNTSFTHTKKSYRLKFSKKTALFGYTKAKSWVLLANFNDPTLIMNSLAFELGHRFGLPFTNHYIHCELILNGVYRGSYVLTEQIQAGAGRVDIDTKTGFLVEADSHYDKEPKFRTAVLQLPIMIDHPEDLPDPSGYDFVKEAIHNLEATLFADSFPDNNYRELIDIDSVIDYIMINEMTKNVDLQIPNSVFMYRENSRDSRIKMGPLWDFDYGFDYNDRDYFNDAEGTYTDTIFREGPGRIFFRRFFDDPYFRNQYRERWHEKYADIAGMEDFIDNMGEKLYESQKMNSRVWWWKKIDYKKELERMKTWWRSRVEYLNQTPQRHPEKP
jgi:spore coat protein CotH